MMIEWSIIKMIDHFDSDRSWSINLIDDQLIDHDRLIWSMIDWSITIDQKFQLDRYHCKRAFEFLFVEQLNQNGGVQTNAVRMPRIGSNGNRIVGVRTYAIQTPMIRSHGVWTFDIWTAGVRTFRFKFWPWIIFSNLFWTKSCWIKNHTEKKVH